MMEGEQKGLSYLRQATGILDKDNVEGWANYWDTKRKVHYLAGNYKMATVAANEALTYWSRLNNDGKIAGTYRVKATYQKRLLEYNKALVSNEKAIEYYRKTSNFEREVRCLNEIGVIHKDLGHYALALENYHLAYEVAVEHGLEKSMANIFVNLGVVMKYQENFPAALEYYEKAERIFLNENDYHGLANVHNNIGNVLRKQERYKEALNYFSLAMDGRKRSGKLRRLGYTYNNIGLTYIDLKDFVKAEEYLKKSEAHKMEFEDYETLASTYLNFTELYLESGDDDKFHFYADKCEKLATSLGQSDVRREVLLNNGQFAAKNEDYKKAYYYLSHVYDEMDTLDEQTQKVLSSVLQARFQSKENQDEIHSLSEANFRLADQKSELEENQRFLNWLIIALSVLAIVLVIAWVLVIRKQRALLLKSKELEETNTRLNETMIGKEEKETLLKEIHHRVKNNLQIIKSLIRLQNSGNNDSNMDAFLMEFEHRVSSMALVHESLYKSGDLAAVNVSEYYGSLIQELISAYNLKQEVTKDISIEIEELGIETLIPLGLLTNEIISNSLKHGFEGRFSGVIRVYLREIAKGEYYLEIGDNGKGFDPEKERLRGDTLGMELIHTLVEQLDGAFEFVNEEGSYYKIKFKSQEK